MYKKCKDSITGNDAPCIKRLSDNAFIPFDPANTDYQAFLKYQAEGGKVYGADEEVPDGKIEQGNQPLPPDEEQQ